MSVVPFPSPMSSDRTVRQTISRPETVAISRERASTASKPVLWLRRWRSRRELAALDVDQIHDAGLDPFAVRREAMKPFWRA